MAYYPQSATGLNYITYPAGPTANGATLTASASANTKGAYTQIAASAAFTCNAVRLFVGGVSGGAQQILWDVATGAAASEVVVIANLLVDNANSTGGGGGRSTASLYEIPLGITSGTRIAARTQTSITGSQVIIVAVTLIAAGGVTGITTFTTYGSLTASSAGTQVDPGGTADTKGSYVQLTASSTAVAQSLLPMFSLLGNSAPQVAIWAIDIATGAGGAEVVLVPDLRMYAADPAGTTACIPVPRSYALLTYIASSTRIAARASCSTNDATDRLIGVALVAGVAPAESGGGGAYGFA